MKVDLGSRGRSWMASPDEYRLSIFLKDDFENASLACACSRKEYSLADFSGRRLSKASPLQYL